LDNIQFSKIIEEDNEGLIKEIRKEEVIEAVRDCNGSKRG